MEKQRDEFTVGGWGILHATACSSLSAEETLLRINRELPCGTTNGWILNTGEDPWGDGQPNPRPCEDCPETHKHYLFTC